LALTAEETSIVASFVPASVEEAVDAASAVPPGARIVEVRLDRIGGEGLSAIREAFRGVPLMATARSVAEGGLWSGRPDDLRRLLRAALDAGFEWVDVELRAGEAILAELPARRVVLSFHDPAGLPADLPGLLAEMEATRAAHLKIVATARDSQGALALLELQAGSRSGRLSCFGMGEAGIATRVLAPYLGARLAFGALRAGGATAPGQLPAADLAEVYGVGRARTAERLFALFGGVVSHSLSPAIHNATFEARGLGALYVPFAMRSLEAELGPLVSGLDRLGLPLSGASVTVPFKEEAARAATPPVDGAVNTLLRRGTGFSSTNTDRAAFEGFLPPPGPGRRALVLGAGGTARAALEALRTAGWPALLSSRTPARAAALAEATGATLLDRLDAAERYDVVVNATPLGMKPGDPLPCPESLLGPGALVIDAPYRPGGTELAMAARRVGATVRDGFELLLAQGALQSELFTGLPTTVGELRSRLPERIRRPFEVKS
jgi:3-dehydroquinate dehydratase / shikimate dehydrogenase